MTPRVKELLQQAIRWQKLLESGKVKNKAEIARREGLSRARVTQIMSLLCLAPEIQGYILAMPETNSRSTVTERSLRPITQIRGSREQKGGFSALLNRG